MSRLRSIVWRSWIAASCLAACLRIAGCASSAEPRPTEADAAAPAVECDRCQKKWVRVVSLKTAPHMEKRMECPDCENAVVHFFKTGDLKHHCDRCEGTLRTCDAH